MIVCIAEGLLYFGSSCVRIKYHAENLTPVVFIHLEQNRVDQV